MNNFGKLICWLNFVLLISCGKHQANNNRSEDNFSSDSIIVNTIYLDLDSSRNCYTLVYPNTKKYTAYVVILPGFGESAQRVMSQTQLPRQLAQAGFLTVIPILADGVLSFGIDTISQNSLRRIINDVKTKNIVSGLPFFIGGYSIGGSCAIKYAEDVIDKPNAVFAVDPPLDFEQLYLSSKRKLRLSVGLNPDEESLFIIQRLELIMNGSPTSATANYYKHSPYSFSDTSQAAIKKLLHLPIRIYTEPDIKWWMDEMHEDYTSMNSTFHSAMINELNRMGNSNAFLMITDNKGYREPHHVKHPHSWSIVDNPELIDWLIKYK